MDIGYIITSIPSWALFSLFIIISILSAQLGSWLAQKQPKKSVKEPEDSIISTVTSSMLGLLAFMLAFTFSITSSRFGDRKQLVIDEANAISICYLRANLLPEKQKQETKKLLKEYVTILTQLHFKADLNKQISRMEDINALLWNQAVTLVQEDMDSELRSLFTSAVNEVIALYNERKTVALIFRIPNVLWSSLLLLFFLSMFSLGYQTGANGISLFAMPLLATAFVLVIILIADMDSVVEGRRFKVTQQPLIELQQMIEKDIP